MSIYVRLQVSFFTNRKTIRLFQAIGNDAYWIPPRLWAYAAQNQPDGDFSDYSAEEIKMLLEYKGDACIMLEALKKAAFLDGMKVHGWSEHNGYHATFSERAKKAATARWGKDKKGKESTGKEEKGKETSITSRMLVASTHSDSAEIPTEQEFIDHCKTLLIAEWFARDKFLAQDAKGWQQCKWKVFARRVLGWFGNDGRPMNPPAPRTNGSKPSQDYNPNATYSETEM